MKGRLRRWQHPRRAVTAMAVRLLPLPVRVQSKAPQVRQHGRAAVTRCVTPLRRLTCRVKVPGARWRACCTGSLSSGWCH